MKGLVAGTLDTVGSDHAPHALFEKALPYPKSPSGMPGVQTTVPVLLTLASRASGLDYPAMARAFAEAPARIYGIRGKGRLEVGMDADVCVVDPLEEVVFEKAHIQSRCGWSPFEGVRFMGWPVHTVLRGKVVVRDRAIVGEPCGEPVHFGPST
jgi:dihydroorotase